MRGLLAVLLLSIPAGAAEISITDTATPDWNWPGQSDTVGLTVVIDCTDLPLRVPEGHAVLHVSLEHGDMFTYGAPAAHEIEMPPDQCASEDNVYTWETSFEIQSRPEAVGLVEHDMTIVAWIENGTVDQLPVAPARHAFTTRIHYVGDVDIALNGTVDSAKDGKGAISVWVENLSNAETLVVFKVESFRGGGTLTLPARTLLESPREGTATGAFVEFAFDGGADWSGHTKYQVVAWPTAAADETFTMRSDTVELVFDVDSSGAKVEDNGPRVPSKGAPHPLWVVGVALAALARRR